MQSVIWALGSFEVCADRRVRLMLFMPLVSRKGRKSVKKSRSVTDVFYTDRTMKVLFYSEIFADKNQYDLWK